MRRAAALLLLLAGCHSQEPIGILRVRAAMPLYLEAPPSALQKTEVCRLAGGDIADVLEEHQTADVTFLVVRCPTGGKKGQAVPGALGYNAWYERNRR